MKLAGIARTCAIAFVFVLAPALASAEPGCATQCRTGGKVTLQSNAGQSVQFDVPSGPYVAADGTITIYPEETLVFRAAGASDGLQALVFVRLGASAAPKNVPPGDSSFQGDARTSVVHDPKTGENVYEVREGSPFAEGGTAEEHLKGEPEGTVIVSYHQAVGRPDMVLRVEHNLPGMLKYDAFMERLSPRGAAAAEATSTCPVRSLLVGQETWPYPLGAISMRNFRLLKENAPFSCD
jgi:hypothetical protein